MISNLISNMPKNEIYDVTFKYPFNCIMSGSSGSGKLQDYLNFYNEKALYAMPNSTKFTTFIQLGKVFTMK